MEENKTTKFRSPAQKEVDAALKNVSNLKQTAETDLDSYLNLLGAVSKFPNYSWNNAYLIAEAMPEATMLKDKGQWRKIGATIKEGAKPISVIAPARTKQHFLNISAFEGRSDDLQKFLNGEPVKIPVIDKKTQKDYSFTVSSKEFAPKDIEKFKTGKTIYSKPEIIPGKFEMTQVYDVSQLENPAQYKHNQLDNVVSDTKAFAKLLDKFEQKYGLNISVASDQREAIHADNNNVVLDSWVLDENHDDKLRKHALKGLLACAEAELLTRKFPDLKDDVTQFVTVSSLTTSFIELGLGDSDFSFKGLKESTVMQDGFSAAFAALKEDEKITPNAVATFVKEATSDLSACINETVKERRQEKYQEESLNKAETTKPWEPKKEEVEKVSDKEKNTQTL